MQVSHAPGLFLKVKENWKIILTVNLSTAIDWILIFISLKYISGSLVNCIVFGVAPLATLLLTLKSYLSKKLIIKDILVTLSICVILLILSFIYYTHTAQPLDKTYLLISISLCTISGFATGVTVITCKMLQRNNFNPLAIIKTRFILLIIASLALIAYFNIDISISYKTLFLTMLLATLFIILPSFLLQKGLETTSAVTAVIVSSSIPVITYLFQIIDPRYHI